MHIAIVDEAILSGDPHLSPNATTEEERWGERKSEIKAEERSEKRVAHNEMIELPPKPANWEVNRAGYPAAR